MALALAPEPVAEPDELLVPEPELELEPEPEPEPELELEPDDEGLLPELEASPEALLEPAVVFEADEDWVLVARVVAAVDESVVESESDEVAEEELELWLREPESDLLILMLLPSPVWSP